MEVDERDGVVGAMRRSVNVVAPCESGGCSSPPFATNVLSPQPSIRKLKSRCI